MRIIFSVEIIKFDTEFTNGKKNLEKVFGFRDNCI